MSTNARRTSSVKPSLDGSVVRAPAGVDRVLAEGVERALRGLPDELLLAMSRGLSAHADELLPGVLFRRRNAGGCAVGITLRELAPDAFDFRWIEFWLWQRWRRSVERDVARSYPRLGHLERFFDQAVAASAGQLGGRGAAREVGLWFAASAERELGARKANTEIELPPTAIQPLPAPNWTMARRGSHDIGRRSRFAANRAEMPSL